MNKFKNIKKVRELIPIGILEAKELLFNSNNSISSAVNNYIEESEIYISEITGEPIEVVKIIFKKHKYFKDACVSEIKWNIKYRNFDISKLENLNFDILRSVDCWFFCESEEDMQAALIGKETDVFIGFIREKIPQYSFLADSMEYFSTQFRIINDNYMKYDNIEETIEESNKIKLTDAYQDLLLNFQRNKEALNEEVILIHTKFKDNQ